MIAPCVRIIWIDIANFWQMSVGPNRIRRIRFTGRLQLEPSRVRAFSFVVIGLHSIMVFTLPNDSHLRSLSAVCFSVAFTLGSTPPLNLTPNFSAAAALPDTVPTPCFGAIACPAFASPGGCATGGATPVCSCVIKPLNLACAASSAAVELFGSTFAASCPVSQSALFLD